MNVKAPQRGPTGFSSGEVARLTGVSIRQLQWWDEQGLICPLNNGHRRNYSESELARVRLAKKLRDRGLSLQKTRRIINRRQPYRGTHLVVTANGSLLADCGDLESAISAASSHRGPVIVVSLEDAA